MFLTGSVGKFSHMCKHFFFLPAYNLFQCLQPLQTVYFKIFHPLQPPPTPPPVKKIMIRPLSGTDQYYARFVPVRNCKRETLRIITFRKTTGKL